MRRTGWYRGDQKPVRVGVYERNSALFGAMSCYWDGKKFHVSNPDDPINQPSLNQSLPWRGITKEAK